MLSLIASHRFRNVAMVDRQRNRLETEFTTLFLDALR
jgi:hypothetical protein